MLFVYILRLKYGKYYVGKTTNPNFRIENHFKYSGSEWTKKYKPIEILDIKENCDEYDEDKITIKCMNEYGIENVRGGTFVNFTLSEAMIDVLKQMINGVNDRCFICSSTNHYAKDCPCKFNKKRKLS